MKWLLTTLLIFFSICPAWADDIFDLIPAIVMVESGGNPHAVSHAGAVGLCQITPIVIKEHNQVHKNNPLVAPYTIADLYDPAKNIHIASWYLRRLRDHYLKEHYTIERMLAAYNGGVGRLKQADYDISKMPRETREYVKKVMAIYKRGTK